MMWAIVAEAGKCVCREVPRPEPAGGEVLVQVHLAGVCGTDLEILKGYGGYEGILGHECVGTVASPSSRLAGKRVVIEINCVCGQCEMCSSGLATHCRQRTVVGISGRPGVFAEYVAVPERNCIEIPDSVGDEQAVFAEPLAAAIQVTRQVRIERRTRVAVLGTGRLGALVAQVVALTGCQLVAVGRNPKTLTFLDRKQIRVSTAEELKHVNDYDVVVECTGSPEGLPLAVRLVRPRGTIVLKTTCRAAGEIDLAAVVVNEVSIVGSRCGQLSDALSVLAKRQVDVEGLVTARLPLSAGARALELADQPEHIKVLIDMAK